MAFMTGRELKTIELKKEIESLKTKLLKASTSPIQRQA